MDLKERLDKILSGSGISSRSEVKKLIRSGRISVNGEPALTPEMRIDRESSEVRYQDSDTL